MLDLDVIFRMSSNSLGLISSSACCHMCSASTKDGRRQQQPGRALIEQTTARRSCRAQRQRRSRSRPLLVGDNQRLAGVFLIAERVGIVQQRRLALEDLLECVDD